MRKKILIADDSQTFLMYIGILLKRMGFTVIPAENGLEVLKLLKLIEPDLILLDIRMPTLDGLTVLRHIKEDKEIQHIPVVMVSGDLSMEMMQKCKSFGCAEYLTKPIKIDKLHDALQECLFSGTGKKRNYLRVPFNAKVAILHNEKQINLYAESLSERGIYLRKKDPFPVGSTVEIVLPLKDGKSIKLQGTVIYIKGLLGDVLKVSPGMAIEFKEIADREADILKKYIEDIMAGDIIESQEDTIIKIDT